MDHFSLAETDVPHSKGFPKEHWSKIHSGFILRRSTPEDLRRVPNAPARRAPIYSLMSSGRGIEMML